MPLSFTYLSSTDKEVKWPFVPGVIVVMEICYTYEHLQGKQVFSVNVIVLFSIIRNIRHEFTKVRREEI